MGLPFSKLEWFFHRIARSISDVHWRFNVPLTDADGFVGLVDAVHDPGRLVVELDGEEFHGDDRFQADRTRDQRLQALGYVVLRFTWQDLTERSGGRHRVRTVIDPGQPRPAPMTIGAARDCRIAIGAPTDCPDRPVSCPGGT